VLVRFHGWINPEETDFQKVRSEAPPHAPKRPEGSITEQAQSIDVLAEGHLEAHVEEELRSSDEPNRLSR
jgi:hypothetical protein